MPPQLPFDPSEYGRRQTIARQALAARRLDGLLVFKQESMAWLTGYESFGFCFVQCLYLGVDGALALLTRAPDRRQAEMTSVIADIRVWADGVDAEPMADLAEILLEHGARGTRLGVEYESYGLTAAAGRRLDAHAGAVATLVDASDLVTRLRAVKTPAELAMVRRAGELADAAWAEGVAAARPGAGEGEVLAAMQGAVFRGDGDYPGNEFIIGSGPRSRLCRYASGRRTLVAGEQLTLEFAGTFRHYHACLMRTLTVGAEPAREQRELFATARDTLFACEEALRPGRTAGEVYAAHARHLDGAGLARWRMNACGYGLGATFTPTWMDWPMFYRDNPAEIATGMVFFIHIIIFDDARDLAMTLGRTSIVTSGGSEPLSDVVLDPAR
jgi:Xaa-Pro dipeptidase